jgi:adenomatosis polyposis coli protein
LCENDENVSLQVTASVLRNLSWRADGASKQTLREVGAVSGLMQAAMEGKKESTLKSILSALWNLSAHCSINKVRSSLALEWFIDISVSFQ